MSILNMANAAPNNALAFIELALLTLVIMRVLGFISTRTIFVVIIPVALFAFTAMSDGQAFFKETVAPTFTAPTEKYINDSLRFVEHSFSNLM